MDKTLRGWQYARHSIEAYAKLLPSDVVAMCRNLSFWNLYYLSNPFLDVELAQAVAFTAEQYQTNLRALGLLHQNYLHLPSLASDLLLKPGEFQKQAYALQLWTFEPEIGKDWWSTFDSRLTVLVQTENPPPRIEQNVIYADFARKR